MAVYLPLPVDPLWKRDYSASVKRLVRDGVDVPLARLFVDSALPIPAETEGLARARSATEAFFFVDLETFDATKGLFVLNAELPIAFDGWSKMEVDFLSRDMQVAIELDGPQHLADVVGVSSGSTQGPPVSGARLPGSSLPGGGRGQRPRRRARCAPSHCLSSATQGLNEPRRPRKRWRERARRAVVETDSGCDCN